MFNAAIFNNEIFNTEGVTPPTPPAVSAGGGGAWYGKPSWKKKRLKENIGEWVDELYAELTESKERKEAAQIVQPHVANKRLQGVPEVSQVDWTSFRKDLHAIQRLLDLYERQQEEEEELLILLI